MGNIPFQHYSFKDWTLAQIAYESVEQIYWGRAMCTL